MDPDLEEALGELARPDGVLCRAAEADGADQEPDIVRQRVGRTPGDDRGGVGLAALAAAWGRREGTPRCAAAHGSGRPGDAQVGADGCGFAHIAAFTGCGQRPVHALCASRFDEARMLGEAMVGLAPDMCCDRLLPLAILKKVAARASVPPELAGPMLVCYGSRAGSAPTAWRAERGLAPSCRTTTHWLAPVALRWDARAKAAARRAWPGPHRLAALAGEWRPTERCSGASWLWLLPAK